MRSRSRTPAASAPGEDDGDDERRLPTGTRTSSRRLRSTSPLPPPRSTNDADDDDDGNNNEDDSSKNPTPPVASTSTLTTSSFGLRRSTRSRSTTPASLHPGPRRLVVEETVPDANATTTRASTRGGGRSRAPSHDRLNSARGDSSVVEPPPPPPRRRRHRPNDESPHSSSGSNKGKGKARAEPPDERDDDDDDDDPTPSGAGVDIKVEPIDDDVDGCGGDPREDAVQGGDKTEEDEERIRSENKTRAAAARRRATAATPSLPPSPVPGRSEEATATMTTTTTTATKTLSSSASSTSSSDRDRRGSVESELSELSPPLEGEDGPRGTEEDPTRRIVQEPERETAAAAAALTHDEDEDEATREERTAERRQGGEEKDSPLSDLEEEVHDGNEMKRSGKHDEDEEEEERAPGRSTDTSDQVERPPEQSSSEREEVEESRQLKGGGDSKAGTTALDIDDRDRERKNGSPALDDAENGRDEETFEVKRDDDDDESQPGKVEASEVVARGTEEADDDSRDHQDDRVPLPLATVSSSQSDADPRNWDVEMSTGHEGRPLEDDEEENAEATQVALTRVEQPLRGPQDPDAIPQVASAVLPPASPRDDATPSSPSREQVESTALVMPPPVVEAPSSTSLRSSTTSPAGALDLDLGKPPLEPIDDPESEPGKESLPMAAASIAEEAVDRDCSQPSPTEVSRTDVNDTDRVSLEGSVDQAGRDEGDDRVVRDGPVLATAVLGGGGPQEEANVETLASSNDDVHDARPPSPSLLEPDEETAAGVTDSSSTEATAIEIEPTTLSAASSSRQPSSVLTTTTTMTKVPVDSVDEKEDPSPPTTTMTTDAAAKKEDRPREQREPSPPRGGGGGPPRVSMSIKPPQVRVQSMTPKDVRRRFNGHKITCVGMLNNELIKIAGDLVLQKPIDMVEYAPLLERLQSNLKYLAAMAAQQQKKDNARKPPEPPILTLPTTPLLAERLNPLYTSLKQYFYAAEKYELQQAQLGGVGPPVVGQGQRGTTTEQPRPGSNATIGPGGGVNTIVTTTILSQPRTVAAPPPSSSTAALNGDGAKDGKGRGASVNDSIVTSQPTAIGANKAAKQLAAARFGPNVVVADVAQNGGNKRTRDEADDPTTGVVGSNDDGGPRRDTDAKRSRTELAVVPEHVGVAVQSAGDETLNPGGAGGGGGRDDDEEVVPANKVAQPTPTVIATPTQPKPRSGPGSRPRGGDQDGGSNSSASSTPFSRLQVETSPAFQTASLPRSGTSSNPFQSHPQAPARPPSAQRNQAYGSAIPAHVQQQQPPQHAPSTPLSTNRIPPNVSHAFAQLTPQQQNYVRQQQYQAMLAQQQQQALNQSASPAPSQPSSAPSPRMVVNNSVSNPSMMQQQPPQTRPPSAMSHLSPYATNAPSPATSQQHHHHPPPSPASTAQAESSATGPIGGGEAQQQQQQQQRPLAERYAGIQSIISAPTFRQLPPALQQNLQEQAQSLLYQMQAATMAMARNGGGPPPVQSQQQPPTTQNRTGSPPVHQVSSPRTRVPSYSQSPQVQHSQLLQQQPGSRMNSLGPSGSQYGGSPPATATTNPAMGLGGQLRPPSAMSTSNANYAPQDSAALFREQLAQQNAIRSGSPAQQHHGSPSSYNQFAASQQHQRVGSNSYGAPSPAAASSSTTTTTVHPNPSGGYAHSSSQPSPVAYAAPSPAAYALQQQQQQSAIYHASAAPSPSSHHLQQQQHQGHRRVSGSGYTNPPSPFYPTSTTSSSIPPPSRPPSSQAGSFAPPPSQQQQHSQQQQYSSHPPPHQQQFQQPQQQQQQQQHTQQPLAPPPVPTPKANPTTGTGPSPSPFLSNAANAGSTMWTPTNVGTPSLGVVSSSSSSSSDLWGNPSSSSGGDPSLFSVDSNDAGHNKTAGGDDAWSEWLNL
ncbi:hypothetical protein JCM3766R1_005965 [Sporobolomyces carnicolor]